MNLHNNTDELEALVARTAEYLKLPEIYIEKDYWVTFLLYNLHHSEYKDKIAFKGGTSLSKGYKFLDRFSEDVDLTVIKKNYREESENEALISKVHKEIGKEPLVYIKNHSASKNSKQYKKRIYDYNKLDESNTQYLHAVPYLVLELNFFNEPTPLVQVNISSYIHDYLKETGLNDNIKEYHLEPFELNLLCTRKTFCEKLLSLYRGAHKGKDILLKRIRHFYDLYMLITKDENVQELINDEKELYKQIGHAIGEEKYHSLFNDITEFLPLSKSIFSTNLDDFKEDLEKVYTSSFSTMVYKKAEMPNFDDVFQKIVELNNFIIKKGL